MKYLWLDLETTGLDPMQHSIIECAAVLTDEHLAEIDRFEARIMSDGALWSIQAAKMHLESGLLDGPDGFFLPDLFTLEENLYCMIDNHLSDDSISDTVVLAGNSVHFDRSFIRQHLPTLDRKLSHRHFDVSVLRELTPLWWETLELPMQKKFHRAMPDVEQALELARFFKAKLEVRG